MTPNPPIFIRTLGEFEIRVHGNPLQFANRAPQRALQLLAALVSQGRRSVSAGSLADLLWPDADGFDAQRALTTTLHRLRRMLGFPQAVRLIAGQLSLDPRFCCVDVWDFESALRVAREPEEIVEALDLYRGPFLGDDQTPWAIAARRRIAALASHACSALDARKQETGQWYHNIGRMSLAMAE
jgi:DNA-binding SARP family transcriptional activator